MATFKFIAKRIGIAVGIIIVVTFVIFQLLAWALDPLEDLRTYNGADKANRIQSMTMALDLNTPAVIRYFKWLWGIIGYLWGQGTFGVSIERYDVIDQLGVSMITTATLVMVAVVLSILLGVVIGIISAIRQYSGFDYLITFLSFFLYSLPTFWVAILLKQFVAIGFNDFLRDPTISWSVIIIFSLIAGIIVYLISDSIWYKRLLFASIGFIVTLGLLFYASQTDWFATPGFGIIGVAVIGLAIAGAADFLTFGNDFKKYIPSLISSALFIAGYLLFQELTKSKALKEYYGQISILFILGYIIIGVIVGLIFGGLEKRRNAKIGGGIGLAFGLLLFIDRLMQAWPSYMKHPNINYRPISTLGSETPNLTGNFWIFALDIFTHLLLPTLTLLLISFASYTRYTRSSMLEVLNSDYIRTARAKGLPERQVVLRHALKNALIPLATIIPLDIAVMLGGAIITETIFGWKGLGSLFQRALQLSDFNVIMGVLVVTAGFALIASIISDLLYVVLDPRIRINN